MKNPLVSVIVPVYNVENYLRRCLDSIVCQTYKNLEIILIDDGSTDESGKICDEYAKKDERIKVIHKENEGLSSARNTGVDNAKGKYVTFVDSDDDITKDYVEYMLRLIQKFNTRISVAPYTIVTSSGRRLEDRSISEELSINTRDALKRLLLDNGITISANAKMYETALCKKIKFPNGKICEDNGTTYKFIMSSNAVAIGNKSIYNYYKTPGSIMRSDFNIRKLDLIELVDEMCKTIIKRFPALEGIAERRMIIARFSVLRQMYQKKLNINELEIATHLRTYIIGHRHVIMDNKMYKVRDKVALLALIASPKFYSFAWNLYESWRYR